MPSNSSLSRLLKKPVCFVPGPSATFRLIFIMPKSPEGGILTYGFSTAVTLLQKFNAGNPRRGRFPRDLPADFYNVEVPGGGNRVPRGLPQGFQDVEIPGGGIRNFLSNLPKKRPPLQCPAGKVLPVNSFAAHGRFSRFFLFILHIFIVAILMEPISPAWGGEKGIWKEAPEAPTARTEVAVAALDGRIYVVGGFHRFGLTDRVEVFDSRRNSWETTASLPEARHHSGIGVSNGKIYVIGGFKGGFSWKARNTVFEYDPGTNHWKTKNPMPTPRGALAVAEHNGKLYAVGGYTGANNTAAFEVYDPKKDSWESLPPLPTPRDHLAAAAVNGRIHAIGGRIKSSYHQNLGTHESFDLADGMWTGRRPLPTPRSGIAAAAWKGKIFVFGGESGEGTFGQNEAYDPGTGNWETMAPMPTPRHGLGAVVLDDGIHVIAGGPKPGGSFSTRHEIFNRRTR